ncbi:hypothetical protein PoB_004224700 [Plakobranchus ocellatus]|uniref:G-protein coupled receptors family 1 profile domain-containing protein n=1 Tax=Plakobranchus ocellatus TaxID=259542 RepID=A0AAV4B8C3_9GAST|nr:hypothetical protein PoB_004224700 [Plakobranchus ocellatus]
MRTCDDNRKEDGGNSYLFVLFILTKLCLDVIFPSPPINKAAASYDAKHIICLVPYMLVICFAAKRTQEVCVQLICQRHNVVEVRFRTPYFIITNQALNNHTTRKEEDNRGNREE